jgi:leucyl/phenylalanyl-tRNA--protein transferase
LTVHADRISFAPPRAQALDRRAALFRESLPAKLRRVALGSAWSLTPSRIRGVPGLAKLCFDELMAPDYALPDPQAAREAPAGLAGIVHDLSVPTLLAAYKRGLYPWAHIAPLKWWSPPRRSVLAFRDFHMSNNLRRLMRQDRFTVTFDRDFDAVIAACAAKREGRWHLTWITPRIRRAYAQAFDAGHAHSFEVWNRKGELVAGGYGLSIGGAFFFESQFARETNASKVGMSVLNWHLAHWDYAFNDGKLMGPLWASVGFREIPRAVFLGQLAQAVRGGGKSGRWQIEAPPAVVAGWKPAEINQT